MMYAWSFAARTPDEVARLVRALSKHRYVKEVDHRLHGLVDRALSHLPAFAPHAAAFAARERERPEIDPLSRDPLLWRPATLDELETVFQAFWGEGAEPAKTRERLRALGAAAGFPSPLHPPFGSPTEETPHPELVLLDWVLLPVEALDAERHAGALAAMADSGEEVDPSAPVYQEAAALGPRELCEGAEGGRLVEDFVVWSEPPYRYADYVFRGASKAAKLADPPVGYEDDEDDEEQGQEREGG